MGSRSRRVVAGVLVAGAQVMSGGRAQAKAPAMAFAKGPLRADSRRVNSAGSAAVPAMAQRLLMRLMLKAPIGDLTPMEVRIAEWVADGRDEQTICLAFNISLPDLTWTLIRLSRLAANDQAA